MKVKISIPNDYNSHEAEKMAIDELYDGDIEACAADEGRLIFDELGSMAKSGGLKFIGVSEHGAIWSGSKKKIKEVVDHLPKWAGWGIVGD